VGQRTNESDTALYGRATYQMMESYWPDAADRPGATKHDIEHSRWYNKVNKVILSKTMKDQKLDNTKIINDDLSRQVNEKARPLLLEWSAYITAFCKIATASDISFSFKEANPSLTALYFFCGV